MNLMFWKKKAATSGDATPGAADSKAVAGASSLQGAPDLAANVLQETAPIKAARLKKRLMVFGALGLLALIPLVLGVAVWKLFFSSSQKNAAPDNVTEQKAILPSPHSDKKFITLPGIELSRVTPQQADAARAARAELKVLKNKEELEGELKAIAQENQEPAAIAQEDQEPAPIVQKIPEPAPMVQKNPEPAHVTQEKPVQRGVQSTVGRGEVMFGSKDATAAAATLKAAIEAMNADTGDYTKKPAVKNPAKKPSP